MGHLQQTVLLPEGMNQWSINIPSWFHDIAIVSYHVHLVSHYATPAKHATRGLKSPKLFLPQPPWHIPSGTEIGRTHPEESLADPDGFWK